MDVIKRTDIFLSYCWADKIYADCIDLYFRSNKEYKNIVIHRDIRDVGTWKNIREYMDTVRKMDYVILLISKNYIKSFNCMSEVLSVMKDPNYEKRIFPAIVEKSVYNIIWRVKYVKYWENNVNKLKNEIETIEKKAGIKHIMEELKKTQDILNSIDEFLSVIVKLNNPNAENINQEIEKVLKEHGIIPGDSDKQNKIVETVKEIPRADITADSFEQLLGKHPRGIDIKAGIRLKIGDQTIIGDAEDSAIIKLSNFDSSSAPVAGVFYNGDSIILLVIYEQAEVLATRKGALGDLHLLVKSAKAKKGNLIMPSFDVISNGDAFSGRTTIVIEGGASLTVGNESIVSESNSESVFNCSGGEENNRIGIRIFGGVNGPYAFADAGMAIVNKGHNELKLLKNHFLDFACEEDKWEFING